MKYSYPILAIDYGEKKTGLAISDSKGIIASPLDTLVITPKKDKEDLINKILNICTEYNIKTILVGKPQIFEENHKKINKKIDKFIGLLKKNSKLPIITYDESFSTFSAENMLTSLGQNRKKTKNIVDRVAATIFLREFLNSVNENNERKK